MTRSPLPRRTVLRGAGAAAVGLPLLEAMLPRRAAAAAPNTRFVFFFHSCGVNPDTWTPSGTETQFTLSPTLEPLAALKAKMVVISGMNMTTALNDKGNAHVVGIQNLLTAKRVIPGGGSGVSLDEEIGKKLAGTAKFPALQFGVRTYATSGKWYCYLSYSGPGARIPCQDDPREMFKKLFTDPLPAGPDATLFLDGRKSVLDFVAEDYRQLAARLGGSDRARVDGHLTEVREIEKRLTVKGAGASCQKPTVASPAGYLDNDSAPNVGKAQMDLLAMALACNLTRSATLQWEGAQSYLTHRWANAPAGGHHAYSHLNDPTQANVGTIPQAKEAVSRIDRWYMTQLAYLGTKLQGLAEINGSVLDNTVVVSGSEVAVGWTHAFTNMPTVLLGGCGGKIRGNRWLNRPGASHGDLYVSIMNAMGIPATTFGDPLYSKGPLPGLLA